MRLKFSTSGKVCVVGLSLLALAACDGTGDGGSGGSNAGGSGGSGAGDSSVGGSGGGGSGGGGSGAGTNVGGSGGGSGGSGGSGGAGGSGGGSGGGGGGGGIVTTADKVDIVLMVDNSRMMADKQEVLALALNDLVTGLTNPPCVDPTGAQPPQQPASPQDACPAGLVRRHQPVADIHLGIISSSIGGHGADVCQASTPETASNNDRAHLLARTTPIGGVNNIPTYDGKGFLAWDPGAQYTPPGESDPAALVQTLSQMVQGVGQIGCGYESQMESWYRFLVDPEPYQSISVVNGQATPQGVDTALLQQREDFLRPDSMLVILTLTDENDCSIREAGQYFYAAQLTNPNGTQFHLPRPRSECAADPNDPCCRSCGQNPGNCPVDPTCYVNGDPAQGVLPLTSLEDQPNLRCHEQKRRFGIDFLYPVDRYVQALTSPMIVNRAGDLVPNPIFSDLNPNDGNSAIRDPSLVVMAGLVGVPWQDIARDPANPALGFQSAEELAQSGTWDVILGDPANHVPPSSPYMIESIDPRAGIVDGNPVNGREWSIPQRNDLQYACIFDLPAGTAHDCSIPGTPCECQAGTDSPLCEVDPATGQTTLQVRAKAYPGLRELSVLKALGPQGVTASICPAQLDDASSADFGYRQAVQGLLDRMAPGL